MLDARLQQAGYAQRFKLQQKEIADCTRDHVWKKVKFAQSEVMGFKGGVSRIIAKKQRYSLDDNAYEATWEKWMRKYVRTTLNEKRSGVCQTVARNLVKGEFSCYFKCLLNLYLTIWFHSG